MTRVIYRDPRIYRGVLRLLYGAALAERERVVAGIVRRLLPAGGLVLDAACGDAGIARALPSGVRYLGVDASPVFVRALERAGREALRADLARDALPRADVVLLLGSLYQFLPDPDPVLDRLRDAARVAVVVAEPYRNLATSRFAPVAALARRMTDPGVSSSISRFDDTSLRDVIARHGGNVVHTTSRERVAVLPGRAP